MSARDQDEQAQQETKLWITTSNDDAHEAHSPPPLYITKNRSTGDLATGLPSASANENGRIRVSFDTGLAGATGARSPVITEHEHGLGISGLRRIRQHPSAVSRNPSRNPSRAPTTPSSPTTPYALPTRSSSMTFAGTSSSSKPDSSPSLHIVEDLTRFPSESLHSFSFARQSEDVLHNRQIVLKRALEFVRDRLGWSASHPGVMTAQAKLSGDAEILGMVELLTKANLIGKDVFDNATSQFLAGPMTGPADVDGKNIFERAFAQLSPRSSVPDTSEELVDGTDSTTPSVALRKASAGSEISAAFHSPPPLQTPPDRPALRRSFTDVSLVDVHAKLVDALARPYKAPETTTEPLLLSPTTTFHGDKSSTSGASAVTHSHPHRWVPAAQAIFTTEAVSPWTILAANDLACLVFGVTKSEVKKLSMLEVVRKDKRAWLEVKLHGAGSEAAAKKARDSQTPTATSSRTSTSSVLGGGITASLLKKPSWRSQRTETDTGFKNTTNKSPKQHHHPSRSRGVLLCGNIVPIQKRNGATGSASLWVKEKRGGLIWVLEEISEDTALLHVDEDANIASLEASVGAIWGTTEGFEGRKITDLIPQLPLIDNFAIDKNALEKNDDAQYYTARARNDAGVPVAVSMDAVTRTLQVSSLPHIAGMVVLAASSLTVINANSVVSSALFGIEDLSGKDVTEFLPQFDDIIEFLTEEEKLALVDGIVVPEHSFRRARALVAVREGTSDAAAVFRRPTGLIAKHRDGTAVNVDVQMRVVRSERAAEPQESVIEEETTSEESEAESEVETSEIVYALWVTYSRQIHSTSLTGGATSPIASRPNTPLHQPSPGQTERAVSPDVIDGQSDEPDSEPEPRVSDSPSTLSQKLREAASQPISESVVEIAPVQNASTASSKGSSRVKKKIADFVILEDMGQGAYGQVKLARYTKGSGAPRKVVLKYVTKKRILVDTWTRDRRLGTVPLEIHVLDYLRRDGLRHPNIVEMIDFFEDDVNYYIEMVPHGLPGMDLFDYIEMRATMDEAECRNIFLQVVAALHHLHVKARVVHRDIKDENIILDGDGMVKLIDFGSAAYIKNGPFDVFVGTIDYAAPEVLQGKSYAGPSQDIWALGILLYTLVYKENPFYSIDEILDHELRVPWVMSEGNINLIRGMLDRDVGKRLDITQVMEDAWCRDEPLSGGESGGEE